MTNLIFWLIIAIAAFAIDIMTSNFFFVLFSVGAIVAAICSIMNVPFMVQIIIFAVISIMILIVGYPWLKKKYKKSHKKTLRMEETYIGKVMEAKDEINNKAQIKVGGEYWNARNEGEPICAGEKFKRIGIEGIKLKVEKI